jgi:uncharacterized phage protein gp47/JayE
VAYGVTETGFVLKRLYDIRNDIISRLSAIQDPTTGETLTPNMADENDPLVQIVDAVSDSLSEAWEQLQLCYDQFDPLKAIGAGLSGLVQLNGIVRNAGSRTTDTFSLTGSINTVIPAGIQVSNIDRSIVFDLPGFTFGGSGEATVTGSCTVNGPVNPAVGNLTTIVTPFPGLYSVTNTGPVILGSDEESDEDLRFRQQRSTAATGVAAIDTIYSAVAGVAGVTFARAYQNTTNVEDLRGLPAKSIAVVAVGGNDDEIGLALFNHVPAGAATYGSTTTTQVGIDGQPYTIEFSRPTPVDIYIDIDISITSAAFWPTDGVDLVKQAIVNYAANGAAALNILSGFDRNGYAPGDSVYASELYTAVNSVQGNPRINTLFVGTAPNPTDSEVIIEWDEAPVISLANIAVAIS